MSPLGGILEFLRRRGPARDVPWQWLLKPTSRLNRQFQRSATIAAREDGDDVLVDINGRTYVWPRNAPRDTLLWMIGELVQPDHPHQYLWGHTRIAPGDVVLDIGACEGAFAAHATELGARVVAIEPSNRMAGIIRRLFEIRRLDTPRIVAAALGNRRGECWMIDNPDSPGASIITDSPDPRGYPIPLLTLDDLVHREALDAVDFIKCDAEGSDADIIRSGPETLSKHHPKLAICTYHADDHYDRLEAFLKPLGYHVAAKGLLRSGGRFRPMMLHAW